MCGDCHQSPCQCSCGECDPAKEPLQSALANFIEAFFGSLTKVCVNGKVEWVLPCDLDVGIPSFPRIPGEGIACYFLRYMAAQTAGITTSFDVVTNVDFTSPDLLQTKKTLTYVNGLLVAESAPVQTVITTAVACP